MSSRGADRGITGVTGFLTRLSLTARIFGAIAAVVTLVLLGVLTVTGQLASSAADRAVLRALDGARYQARSVLAARERAMIERAAVVVGNPTFRSLVQSQERAALQDQVEVAAVQIAASWVQVVGMDGIRLVKSDEPAADGVDLTGSTLIQRALGGESVGALGAAQDTVLQVVALPITGVRAQVGVLMAVRPLTTPLLDSLKAASGGAVEVALYGVDPQGAAALRASTVGLTDDVRRAVATASVDTLPSVAPRSLRIHGTEYLLVNEPLRSASGARIGGLLILRDREAEFAAFSALRRSIVGGGLAGLLLAGVLAILLARHLTRPIGALVQAARRAAEGDYASEVQVNATGEVAVLASAFRSMLADLREKGALVEFLASGGGTGATRRETLPPAPREASPAITADGLLPIGSRLAGRFEIQAQLGRGGMGVVYRALDHELGESVAIKVLRSDYLTGNPQALDRFKSEIRLARRISHRNVVRTHDLGELSGLYYITMEFAEGKILADVIAQRGALPPAVVQSVGKQLLRALEVAHEAGVIHRDIKPENIVLQADGVLKVMDFGIARQLEGGEGLTQAQVVVGTPQFMAPEQLMGEALDGRTDLYAAGCVLYQCAVGRAAVELTGEGSYMQLLFRDDPIAPHIERPTFPNVMSELIMRMMAKERSARPESAAVALAMLEGMEVG